MASIRLKDYLESLSTKGTISDNDLVPLLDSDSTNALKTTTKGTLTNLNSITGFNTFSSSVNSALDTLQFASSSNVSTSLEQSVDIAVLGAYTASQNTINTTNTNHRSAVNSYTGSQNTINTSVNSHILGISNYTSSNNSVIANIQAYTSSLKGAIEISGQDVNILGMLTAQQFNITRVSSSVQFQSGSTEFGDTSDDTHTFTGTILLNGSAIGLSELNSYTSSQNTINTSVNSHILKQATQTGSQDLVNLGISTYTGSQNVINNSVDSHILAISTYTGSNELWKAGVRDEISGIEAWTSSLDSTYATDAQLYQLYQTTASIHLTTQSLNTQTGSQDLVNLSVSTYTGSNELWKAGVRDEISAIEAWTSSLDSTYATDAQLYQLYAYTASQNIINNSVDSHILGVSTYTGSNELWKAGIRGEVNGLEAYTSSLKSALNIDGNNDVYFTGKITAQEIHTTYTTSSVLFQSGSSKFGNTLDDKHEITGSVSITGSIYVSSSYGIINTNTTNHSLIILGSTSQQIGVYYDSVNYAAIGARSNGDVQIYGYTSGTGYKNILLGVDGASVGGNVGIGISLPTSKLHTYLADGVNDNILKIQQGTDAYASGINIIANNDGGAAYNFINSQTNGGTEHWRIGSGATTNTMTLSTGGTERVIIKSNADVEVVSGNLLFATGKGIDFSATSNGSGTTSSELLNDYEEGTFTPTIIFGTSGTATYSIQSGFYTKIGRQVTAVILISFNDNDGTGVVSIGGLPFTSLSTNYCRATGTGQTIGMSGMTDGVQFQIPQNNTKIDVFYANGGVSTQVSEGNTSSDTDIYCTITYFTA